MIKKLLSLLPILILVINAVKSDEESKNDSSIVELDSPKFYDTIVNNKHVLVEFYAPWCEHCKLFEPEFVRIDKTLRSEKSDIILAKVNGAQEMELMKNFNVRSFPTLILFVDQKPFEYKASRHWKDVLFWAKKKSGMAAINLATVEELNTLKDEQDVAVIGLFKSIESPEVKIFKQIALEFDSAAFAITTEQSIFDELNLKPDTVVIFKLFDEGRVDFPSGSINEQTLRSFVTQHHIRLVTEFSSEVAWIFTDRIKTFCMLFVDRMDPEYANYYYAFKAAAERFRGQVVFVFFDLGKNENKQMVEFLGVRKEDPAQIRLVTLVDELVKYKPDNPEISTGAILSFVDDFLAGKLKPSLLSQELPSDWNSKPVKVLVAKNFNQVARDPKKTVLVAFYAPWCPRSQELEPIYNELAEKFSKRPNEFVIAKIDATKNELEEFKIFSLPTIKLFPKGSDKVIDFKGERTLEALSKFVFTLGKESDADEDDLDKVLYDDDDEEDEKDEKDEL